MLKVLELFAGIGACSKALTNLGIEHEIIDAVEIDKYAIKSFNAVHGTNFGAQDITTWDKDIECDLIMHGSPCQDFSVAGKQAGGDEGSGTRSSLLYETLRIVEKTRPDIVIWENVKNLLSKRHKHNWQAYADRMSELGYDSCARVLNAKDYGIPQNRERVFTVSIKRGSKIVSGFTFPEPSPLEKRLKDVLESEVDEKYYLTDEQVAGFKASTERAKAKGNGFKFEPIERERERVMHSVTTRAGQRQTDNFIKEPSAEPRVIEAKTTQPQSALVQPVDRDYKKHGGERKTHVELKKDGVSHALRTNGETLVALPDAYGRGVAISTMQGGKRKPKILEAKTTRGGDITSTIRASIHKQGSRNLLENIKNGRGYEGVAIRTANKKGYDMANDGDGIDLGYPQSTTRRGRVGHGVAKTIPTGDSQGTLDGFRIRKLTPRECWRLMGFDDADFDKAQAAGISNTQLYKQAGNSIVVNVLEEIMKGFEWRARMTSSY